MSDRPFLRFIDLVSIDQKVQSLVQKIATLDKSIDEINKRRTDHALFSEEMQNKILQCKKNVDVQELEMKVLDEKEREKKKFFETLSDYKEYQAVKNEIEAIQRLQVNQEKAVLEAWNQLESAQSSLEKKKRESVDDLQELDEKIGLLVKEKEMFLHELTQIKDLRESKIIGIPQEWLDKYNLMGQRVANPVVAIEHQSCGGCYQQLIAQDLIRARRGALLQCKKCFRLLYLPEIMEQ